MTEHEKTVFDLTPYLIRLEHINVTQEILRLAGERIAALNERTYEQAVIHSQAQRIEELEKDLSEVQAWKRDAERVTELERFIDLAFDAHPNLDLDVAAAARRKGEER